MGAVKSARFSLKNAHFLPKSAPGVCLVAQRFGGLGVPACRDAEAGSEVDRSSFQAEGCRYGRVFLLVLFGEWEEHGCRGRRDVATVRRRSAATRFGERKDSHEHVEAIPGQ